MKKALCVLSLGFLATAGITNAAVSASGLSAYWDFNNNGNDTAASYAGNADTGNNVMGPVGTHDGSYGAGLFGGGGYIGIGTASDGSHFETAHHPDVNPVDPNGNFTVAWWGNASAPFSTGWQAGVAKGEGNNWRFHRTGDSSTISWQGGGGDINSAANGLDNGVWHFFVGTKEADGSRNLYVDGVLSASGPGGTAINIADTTPMMVGENPQANNREWVGQIDDVSVWQRALTGDEVGELYSRGLAGESLGQVIPEPTSGLLGAFAASLLLIRRRR
ncbi:MAG: LamG domain-containing protein [Verrucomicrobiales bacterium]